MDTLLSRSYRLLYQLGVTANYIGFFYTAYAMSLCAEQPDRLLLVTKNLYQRWRSDTRPTGRRWSGTSGQ